MPEKPTDFLKYANGGPRKPRKPTFHEESVEKIKAKEGKRKGFKLFGIKKEF